MIARQPGLLVVWDRVWCEQSLLSGKYGAQFEKYGE